MQELGGLPGDVDDWRRVLRMSVLQTSLDLLGGERDDSYAFTHGLMYATDSASKNARSRDLPRWCSTMRRRRWPCASRAGLRPRR